MKRKREIRIDKMIKVKEKHDINRIDTYHEINNISADLVHHLYMLIFII